MNVQAFEANFDALVGPTHNYAGLSYGNLASTSHRGRSSNPRQAALQGLAKMKLLADLGVPQGVLPPQDRPDLATLRRLGFSGTDAQVIERAHHDDPILMAACYSSSSMWAANAATVSPSPDTANGRVHLTPANLFTQFHRSLEPAQTAAMLRQIFPDEQAFAHHDPLPAATWFADEGAANHMRLCAEHGGPAVEVFVYGRSAVGCALARGGAPTPVPRTLHSESSFPVRQSLVASQSVARLHQLDPASTLFLRQSPRAIDAGAFHNDVVAVANRHVLMYHVAAFADGETALRAIDKAYRRRCGGKLVLLEAAERDVPLPDAIKSYLFNSQIVDLPDGTMALICPGECLDFPSVQRFIGRILDRDTPIRSVRYVDLRQSMRNGGGPACLRLRVVMTGSQAAKVHPGIWLTDALYHRLVAWVTKHYRDRLVPRDLADPNLMDEGRSAMAELRRILCVG